VSKLQETYSGGVSYEKNERAAVLSLTELLDDYYEDEEESEEEDD
jgi:hypothetical protein